MKCSFLAAIVRRYPSLRLAGAAHRLELCGGPNCSKAGLTQFVEKTYDVWVTGYTPGGERRLAKPITLDGYTIRPPKVKLLKAEGQSAKFRVTIHEGRNRQVRRMCDAAGMHCTRLRRIQEGSLRLGDLSLGKWRYLTEAEVAGLVRTPGTSGTI